MHQTEQQIFDRSLVRLRRNRAGRQTQTANFLVDLVAEEIADRLSAINRDFETCVLHNAEDGALARALAATGKVAWSVATDSTEPQLRAGTGSRAVLDEESLPFSPRTLALFVSALSLNFANDLPGALIQIRRALRPDGLFLAAMLGGETLCELRHAMLAAEAEFSGGASPRVAPFADIRDLGSLLQRAGFALPVVDADRLTARYDTAFHLMRELKAMALTSSLAARSRTPATRGLLQRTAEIYHDTHAGPDGRVPATFHVIYLTGWAPHESQQKPLRPGSAQQRLADALGTDEHKL
jgi:SAM-dependent methyltransferase